MSISSSRTDSNNCQKSLKLLFYSVIIMQISVEAAIARGPALLYFADNDAKTVNRIELDGSDHRVVAQSLGSLHGVAVDSVNRKIYWSEGQNVNSDSYAIHQSDLVGRGQIALYREELDFRAATISHLDIDVKNQHVYWLGSNNGVNSIKRINTDGTNATVVVQNLPGIGSFDFARSQQRLYFGYSPNDNVTIGSTKLDGTDLRNETNAIVTAFDVDERRNYIYGAEFFDDEYFSVDLNTSTRIDFDYSTVNAPRDILRYGNHIYFTGKEFDAENQETDSIFRANLDGSNRVPIYARPSGHNPNDPIQLAIYIRGIPEPCSLSLLGMAVICLSSRRKNIFS